MPIPSPPRRRFALRSLVGVAMVFLVLAITLLYIEGNSLRGFVLHHVVQTIGGSETVFYGRLSPMEQVPVPANAHAIYECPTDALPAGYAWMHPQDFNDGYGPKTQVPGLKVYEYADSLFTAEKNASLTGSTRWPGRTYGFPEKPDTIDSFLPGKVYHVRASHGFEFACTRHCSTTCTPPFNCRYDNIVYNQLGCVDQCGTLTCDTQSSSSSSFGQNSSSSSFINLLCGNGTIDALVSGTLEECDDGNVMDGDGCFDTCATMMRPYKFEGSSSSSSSYDAGPRVYILDTENKTIQSMRPDITGTGAARVVLAYGNTDRSGLAVDPTARKMYWLNNTAHTVQRANLDGTQREVFASFSGSTALGFSIAIDSANRYVYWSEYTANPLVTRVLRKEMSVGSETKLTLRIIADFVEALAIENTLNYPNIYFSLQNQNKIMKLSYPNLLTTVLTVPPQAGHTPFALDVSSTPKKIYWIDSSINALRRANIDGSAQETIPLSWTPSSSMISLTLDTARKNIFFGSRDGLSKVSFTGGIVSNTTYGMAAPAFLQYFTGP